MAAAADMGRFSLLSEEELDDLLNNKDSKSTHSVISASVKVLEAYILERRKGMTHLMAVNDSSTAADYEALNLLLRGFYAEIRKVSISPISF